MGVRSLKLTCELRNLGARQKGPDRELRASVGSTAKPTATDVSVKGVLINGCLASLLALHAKEPPLLNYHECRV